MTAPARTRPAPIAALVIGTRQLSPTLTRVVLGGPDLARFQASSSTDAYVKLTFLTPGVDYPRPLDLAAIRAQMPPEHWPVVRTYTVRSWDAEAGELTIDFVVHGDAGVAGPWAASAQAGDELLLAGPGGAYAPAQDAGFHLYVGDESALPAIAAALDALPASAVGRVLIEVHDSSSEFPLDTPAGVVVDWVHAGDRPVGAALVDAVAAVDFGADDVDAFVHGEAGFVKELRRVLRVERGVPKERLSISGYWRLGATEEG
ncbi:NADPH-dependent ferric siderophore reductase [Nakamurella sp. UYEF19]|uniref:siderophore-interacting protein n=1 Tax=Nakamurella sp. UYEF19 TaxID=1756392 RepID=UPI003399E656